MKTLTYILLIALFIGCKKEKIKSGNVTFYQMEYGINYTLYINNERIQPLPPATRIDSNFAPNCGENIWPVVVSKQLAYGRHSYYLKTINVTSDTFYFQVNSDCKVIKIE